MSRQLDRGDRQSLLRELESASWEVLQVARKLHRLQRQDFWGNVTVHFQQGRPRKLTVNQDILISDSEDSS